MHLRLALLFCLLLLSDAAVAHQTWALARNGGEGKVSIQLSHGTVFPVGDHPVSAEHLQSAWLLPAGRESGQSELQPSAATASYLPMEASAAGASWALATISLKPGEIELDTAGVEEYLRELGDPEALRTAWSPGDRWRERFYKHAKALVRMGEGRADTEAMDAGMVFEFIPLQDPTRLRPGQPLDFRLEFDDQPLADHRVGMVYANSHGEVWTRTDANGLGRLVLAHPGWALLHSVVISPSDEDSLDWESHFATLSFEIPHPEISENLGGD